MIIRREVLKAALAVTSENERGYVLQGMQIRPDGTVCATNGHTLLEITDGSPFPDAEFPSGRDGEGGGRLAPFKGNPLEPVMLPADVALQLLKVMPKRATIPILAAVQLSTNGDAGGVVYSATDLGAAVVSHVNAETAGGKFPDATKVQPPAGRAVVTLSLTTALLKDLIEAREAIDGGKGLKVITFEIPTEAEYHLKRGGEQTNMVSSVVRVSFEKGGLKVAGLIMPCFE